MIAPSPTAGKSAPKTKLSAKAAAKLYAKHKTDTGWCVEMSGNFPILLNAMSDITGSVQSLRGLFPDWATAEKIKVDCPSYPAFLTTLHDRVIPEMHKIFGKGMRPCPDRFIFDDNGIKLANIYNPAVMSEPVALPAPFNIMADLFGQQVPEVLAQLFARAFPVEVERKFVVQRLAAIVQTPMKRAKHALFLVGEGGTGKSTILDILESALCGRHIDRSATYTGAQDPFSEVFVNNRVVAFEDKAIGSGGESYVYTNLKQVIDYNRRRVSIKHGQRSVMREVHCSIVITTNNPNLFPWDANERRFYAPQRIVHLVSEEESGVFLTHFHTFLQLPEAAAVLYHWLANVDLTGFDYGRCPRTPYMQELIDQGGTMLDKNLDDFLDDRDIFHPKELNQYLAGRKQTFKTDELKQALGIRGYEYVRPKFKCQGFPDARFSVWRTKPAVGRHFRDLTDEEKAELMMLEAAAR